MSHKREEIHIRTGRKMCMHDVKIMIFDIFYSFVEMIIRLEMALPGNTIINE